MSIAVDRPATVEDLLSLEGGGREFEIVRGVLVETPSMGMRECAIAARVIRSVATFTEEGKLGPVFNSHAKYRLARDPDLVRMPDVSFVRWDRLPGRQVPEEEFVDLAPDLAVEIVSPTNRASEIQEKIAEFFEHGVRLVWIVYPDQQQVYVYEAVNRCRILERDGVLDGGSVLPGFRLAVSDIFSQLVEPAKS